MPFLQHIMQFSLFTSHQVNLSSLFSLSLSTSGFDCTVLLRESEQKGLWESDLNCWREFWPVAPPSPGLKGYSNPPLLQQSEQRPLKLLRSLTVWLISFFKRCLHQKRCCFGCIEHKSTKRSLLFNRLLKAIMINFLKLLDGTFRASFVENRHPKESRCHQTSSSRWVQVSL